MFTHNFPHTPTGVLVDAETALAEFLDEARQIVANGDLEGSLFAELCQLKGQLAAAVERRPDKRTASGHPQSGARRS